VCKPKDRNDTGYLKLTSCIDQVIEDYTSRITVHLSVKPIGTEVQIARISEQLKRPEVSVVGLFGMGGAGKTTLSKQFYNLKARDYAKSCYLDKVAEKKIEDVQRELLQGLCGESALGYFSPSHFSGQTSFPSRVLQVL
jgi:ABC-type Mn2+/Zn2+ transport system ATPase subunit